MKDFGLECVILALTTMMEQKGKKRGKTDKRDAKNIAKHLVCHTCSSAHISTEEDEPVKEYIRMRDDIKAKARRLAGGKSRNFNAAMAEKMPQDCLCSG